MKFLVILFSVLLVHGTVSFAKVGGGDIVFKMPADAKDEKDAVFSHEKHVGYVGKDQKKIGCRTCHVKIYVDAETHKFVTMDQMEKGQSCGVCHDGKNVFDVASSCKKCHKE